MKVVYGLMIMFVVAQLIGICTGIVILTDISKNPYVSSLVVTGDTNDPLNALYFIAYTLVGAAVMVLLIRTFKLHTFVFRFMEFMLVSSASSIVFYAFLRLAMGYEGSMAAGILMGLAFGIAKMFMPQLKNPAAVLATAGAGVVFGISLGLVPVILFLILLAIYDYLSVFVTKHMVEMANFVVHENLAFTITAMGPPEAPGGKPRRGDLGTGDIMAPVMLEVSALMYNPIITGFVFIGAVAALSLFLFLVWRNKMILPAVPPIVAGMLVFMAIGHLLGFY